MGKEPLNVRRIDPDFSEDWPQTTPQDEWDELPATVVGRVEGGLRERKGVVFDQGDTQITFKRPVRTRFVQVIDQDGQAEMVQWNVKTHGRWQDIPNLGETSSEVVEDKGIRPESLNQGMTPSKLAKHLTGHGTEERRTEGRQFENERKRSSASRTDWKSKHNPGPKRS